MVTTIRLITYTIPRARLLAITILKNLKDVISFYKKFIIDIMLLTNFDQILKFFDTNLSNFDSCFQIISSICLNNISPKVISVLIFTINIKNVTLRS
jgi:hypothetical protein